MTTKLDLKVERDFLESLTRSNGTNAIAELIWNSLDADATLVEVTYTENVLGAIDVIEVADNGSGIEFRYADDVFGKLGGSQKKFETRSPGKRRFHGKEGKGRFKAFALGDEVVYRSVYQDVHDLKMFEVILNGNDLRHPEVTEPVAATQGLQPGVRVTIKGVNPSSTTSLTGRTSIRSLEEKFALYHSNYPDFTVVV